MSLLSKKSQGARGALSLYGAVKQSDKLYQGSETGPWSSTWEARGPAFPFMCPTNSTQEIVFLEDVRPLVVHKVATSWSTAARGGSWPRHDYARSMIFTGEVTEDGELLQKEGTCLFSEGLGRDPQFIYVARILNLTEYTNKEGKVTPWRVQPIIIDNQQIIEHLLAISDSEGRDMRGGRMRISRGGSRTSRRIGDSWIPQGFIEDEELNSALSSKDEYPDIQEKIDAIDLTNGYPMYGEDEAKSILRLHRKLVDEHGTNVGWFTYDPVGMERVLGSSEPSSDESSKDKKLGGGSILSGGSLKLNSGDGGLNDLPDADEASLVDPFSA